MSRSVTTRAMDALRRGGPAELAAAARRNLARAKEPRRPSAHAYQEKLAGSLDDRCDMIDAALPDGRLSVLDIGCNLGDIGAHLAERGHWVVGLDNVSAVIAEARRRHAHVPNLGLMWMDLRPEDIDRLPVFDAVLMLSVHHHWLMAHGPEVAGGMLHSLAARTGSVMIFEGASRKIRYGDYAPDMLDNDEASVTGYLNSYLHNYVGDDFASITLLGKTECVGEREPFRWSYGLHK